MSSDGRRKYRRDLYKLKIPKKVGTNKKHQIKDKAQRPTYMTSKEQDIQQKWAAKKKEQGLFGLNSVKTGLITIRVQFQNIFGLNKVILG